MESIRDTTTTATATATATIITTESAITYGNSVDIGQYLYQILLFERAIKYFDEHGQYPPYLRVNFGIEGDQICQYLYGIELYKRLIENRLKSA